MPDIERREIKPANAKGLANAKRLAKAKQSANIKELIVIWIEYQYQYK